jgi:hypothetical protein
MKSNSSRSIPSQIILGAFVIGLGVLFLLDNLDILDFHRAFAFWPTVFILLGVVKLLDSTSPNGTIVGSALIGVGVMLTLNRLGWVHIDLRAAWPMLLIALGVAVVYRALAGRRVAEGPAMVAAADSEDIVDVTAVLGGFERRITTQNFRGGEIIAVMGGCALYLRGSQIATEATINVFVMWGGITLKCPPDWTVVLHGTPIMGGFTEKTTPPPDNSKRLIVRGYAIMGGVDVRN